MPNKGQTCLNCTAICCYGKVSYRYTPEGLTKQTARVANGETSWADRSLFMTYTHKELLGFGMVEVELPQGKPCGSLTPENKCAKQKVKPALCKSYWCHGKYWSPKENGVATAYDK